MADTRKTGSFEGKSNKLGSGGRAAQLEAKGVPGGVIGAIARRKGAAPGQKHFHAGKGNPGRTMSDRMKRMMGEGRVSGDTMRKRGMNVDEE